MTTISETRKVGKPFKVYLIHLAEPVGRARHYTGIAKADRLPLRMREHGHGYGAVLTRKAAERGIAMYLAGAVSVDHPSEERRIKRQGHAKARCLICRNEARPGFHLDAFFQLPVLPRGSFRSVSW